MYHPDLKRLGVVSADQAKQHYLQQGRTEGRPYKRLRVLMRYTACTGLINQHYSHIAAFSLAAALGAELILPPAVCRDSFAHYFRCVAVAIQPCVACHCFAACPVTWLCILWASMSQLHICSCPPTIPSLIPTCSMNREKNEVRWSPVPLESLLDVDAIIDYWRPRGMVVHRTPSLRPFPDLTMPDVAYPMYPLGSLDPNLVVR